MTEEVKKAFDFAADVTKQLITLSTGITALTITFSKDFVHPPADALPFVYGSWWFLILSVAFGILTLASLTWHLANREKPIPQGPIITTLSFLQFLTFGAGLILTVIFGIRAV